MQARVSHLWRHPIKGHGAESMQKTVLTAGKCMPWDRVWAIAHAAARLSPEDTDWAHCANFSRGAKSPDLMAIRAETDETTGVITLRHPRMEEIRVNPDDSADARQLIDWAGSLSAKDRPAPAFISRAADRSMTDSPFPSVSILSLTSLRDLSDRLGQDLDMRRFRGNIWLEDLPAWAEFDLVGQEIRIGGAVLAVRERITRCLATTANPETGTRDADTLGTLKADFGHQDFGVYGEVTASGPVAVGDAMTLT